MGDTCTGDMGNTFQSCGMIASFFSRRRIACRGPNEALDMAVPASRYQPSLPPYPERLPPIEYDVGVSVRRVQQKGEVHFRGQVYPVSRAFRGYPVGLVPTTQDGIYEIRFCHQRISTIDIRSKKVSPMYPARL